MYVTRPTYPVAGGEVRPGLPASQVVPGSVLSVDGVPAVDWDTLVAALTDVVAARGLEVATTDLRMHARSWSEVRARTATSDLSGDPHFARLCEQDLAALLDVPPAPARQPDVIHVVFGPGAALVPHDRLWYADLPRDLALQAVREGSAGNLAQPPGEPGDAHRLQFVDWPILDRHRATLVARLDTYVDASDPGSPKSLAGGALRATLTSLARRPFRTRPHFHPGVWGGQWLRRRFGLDGDEPNLAWSYELIAPEAGILLGDDDHTVEVPLDLLLAHDCLAVLGSEDAGRFGTSFPLRFDYLDTWEGQPLSVHCHPVPEYMRDVFGWSYTQHESYYVMDTLGDRSIYLGLQGDADLTAFREAAVAARDEGTPLDVTRYVRRLPAERHQLYLVPAGTPHGSGEGNVVLEISATPYAYSLRFYDWLRADLDGAPRPVHLEHAFANVTAARRGAAVDELVQEPVVLRRGEGWVEERLGALGELFFEVRRLTFDREATDATGDRCHVLNLVEGTTVDVVPEDGPRHRVQYGETIVVPAAVGAYRLEHHGSGTARMVKAHVRSD